MVLDYGANTKHREIRLAVIAHTNQLTGVSRQKRRQSIFFSFKFNLHVFISF